MLIALILEFDIWLQLKGDLLDLSDAFLWIIAFIFFELNAFSWNQETREGAKALSPQASKS